jgi:hypothetical protein
MQKAVLLAKLEEIEVGGGSAVGWLRIRRRFSNTGFEVNGALDQSFSLPLDVLHLPRSQPAISVARHLRHRQSERYGAGEARACCLV